MIQEQHQVQYHMDTFHDDDDIGARNVELTRITKMMFRLNWYGCNHCNYGLIRLAAATADWYCY